MPSVGKTFECYSELISLLMFSVISLEEITEGYRVQIKVVQVLVLVLVLPVVSVVIILYCQAWRSRCTRTCNLKYMLLVFTKTVLVHVLYNSTVPGGDT